MARPRDRIGMAAVVALCVGLGLGAESHAQGWTPDPYNIVGEFNRQYQSYMFNTYPSGGGQVPNQDRLEPMGGPRSANQFGSYVESLDGEDDFERPAAGMSRGSGPGTPYYRAYRRYDQEFKRTYRPNNDADESYYRDQDRRNAKYFKAMGESDPRRRAQMLREYNLEHLRASRSLSRTRGGMGDRERDRDRDRDRDAGQDRLFGTRRSSDADDLLKPDARRSTAPRPSGTRGGSPLFGDDSTARSRARGGTGLSPSPGTGRRSSLTPRTGDGVSDLLERSDLMERGTRSSTPAPRRSRATAPPPPSSLRP
jgi:hypothetical protein